MILPVITLWVANINLQQSSLAQQLRQPAMLAAIRRASSLVSSLAAAFDR
jgi:hypothetical protein